MTASTCSGSQKALFLSYSTSLLMKATGSVNGWPEYGQLGLLHWLVPSHVLFHVVSAIMPDLVLNDVKSKLQMQPERTATICHSNDRLNIYFLVEEMKYSTKCTLDLEHILHLDGKAWPPKFMVFVRVG